MPAMSLLGNFDVRVGRNMMVPVPELRASQAKIALLMTCSRNNLGWGRIYKVYDLYAWRSLC